MYKIQHYENYKSNLRSGRHNEQWVKSYKIPNIIYSKIQTRSNWILQRATQKVLILKLATLTKTIFGYKKCDSKYTLKMTLFM